MNIVIGMMREDQQQDAEHDDNVFSQFQDIQDKIDASIQEMGGAVFLN